MHVRGPMARRVVIWGEVVAAFLLLYVGIPWTGLQVDRILGLAPLPLPVRWAGLALLVLGAAGIGWCFTLFVRRGRGTPNPLMPPQALVTEGPFAWTRNPITLSHASALFGLSLFLGSAAAAPIVVVLAVPVHVLVVHEERTLEARFGDAYRTYRAAVPRWVPRRPRRQS